MKIRTKDNYTGLTLRQYIVDNKELFKMVSIDVNIVRVNGIRKSKYYYVILLETTASNKSISKILESKEYRKYADKRIAYLKGLKESDRPINTIEEMDMFLIEKLEQYGN